ncbi:hypothetical protein DNTS_006092 [Danionella cerebrum]|uniref:Fcf2 pre-rRNA processing C-terminal domain-containing protein n=1 Tax=Danionella cerebrum TaxID=2873325 RepID=A0A553R1H3_9TELE|nr:hypothetical protein DNTS_006092 [Danionella translucida]
MPTPSARRTRRRTIIEENLSQSDSQPDELNEDPPSSSAASPHKQETRRSTRLRANRKQPESTHDADVSESDSCCSFALDVQATPRTRRRNVVQEKSTHQDEAPAAEPCLPQSVTRSQRASRSLMKLVLTAIVQKDEAKDNDEDASGAESCSSAVSLSRTNETQRITRSHRKKPIPSTEADHSEQDSCSSSVSGIYESVVRRSTRNQKVKPNEPIPLSFDDPADSSSTPIASKPRGRRLKTGNEESEHDSEGCKTVPSRSLRRSMRRQPKDKTIVFESDSESAAADVCFTLGSGTPCSSRTGSASSSQTAPVTRTRNRVVVGVPTAALNEEGVEDEKVEGPHECIPVKDAQLDCTMDCNEVQECTMVEERAVDVTLVFDQDEPEVLELQTNAQTVKEGGDVIDKDIEEQTSSELAMEATPEDPTADVVQNEIEEHTSSEHVLEATPEHQSTNVVEKAVEQTSSELTVDSTPENPAAGVVEEQTSSELVVEATADVVEEEIEEQTSSELTVDSTPEDPAVGMVEEEIEEQTSSELVVEATADVVEEGIEEQTSSELAVEATADVVEKDFEEQIGSAVDATAEDPLVDKVEKNIEDGSCAEVKIQASTADQLPEVFEKDIDQTCETAKEENIQEDSEQGKAEEPTEIQSCSYDVAEDLVEATPAETEKENGTHTSSEEQEPRQIAEPMEKGVKVSEETLGLMKFSEDDIEGPSTSSFSHGTTDPPPKTERISLLDSSEDEDSADEDLSSGEEGCSKQDDQDPVENWKSEEVEALGNGLFVIDTRPGHRAQEEMQLSSSIDTGLKMKELGGLYVSFDGNPPKSLSSGLKTQKQSLDKLLEKSVLVPDFEKKDAVPPYKESTHAAKLKRKAERDKTTGDGWFNMKAPELTEELKNDLKVLKMRSALNPKHFYKKNDREGFPKYFQVGTVVDSPVDFYHSRIPKKQRKQTIVEELLADAEFRSSNKRRYQEIMSEKAAQAAGKQHKKKKSHKKQTNA